MEMLVRDGLRADFVVCGELTDMHVGVQAKGVLMVRVDVGGTAVRTAPPRGSATMPSCAPSTSSAASRPCSPPSRPRCSSAPRSTWAGSRAAMRVNKVPDLCRMDVDVRYLLTQSPEGVLAQIRSLDPRVGVEVPIQRPADVPADHPMVRTLLEAASRHEPSSASVKRDGASTRSPSRWACRRSNLARGGGHHGPEEYVEIESLPRYRRALVEFARMVAAARRRRCGDAGAGI